MKREFPFEMALKALEVTWSSLPPATADTNLCLWETRFSPKMSPSTSDLSKPCETAYGKVAALRKLSVDRQLSDNTDVRKRSVCNRGRISSDNCENVKGRAFGISNRYLSHPNMESFSRILKIKRLNPVMIFILILSVIRCYI